MRKITLFAATLLITFASFTTKATAAAPKMDQSNLYPCTFIVYEIDRDEDIIFLTDANGFEWEYEGVEDWHAGDVATAMMYDNGTPKIFDDEIIKLHFAGWNIYDGCLCDGIR